MLIEKNFIWFVVRNPAGRSTPSLSRVPSSFPKKKLMPFANAVCIKPNPNFDTCSREEKLPGTGLYRLYHQRYVLPPRLGQLARSSCSTSFPVDTHNYMYPIPNTKLGTSTRKGSPS